MSQSKIAKTIIYWTIAASVQTVVGNMIKSSIPKNAKPLTLVATGIGSFFISSYVSDLVTSYVMEQVETALEAKQQKIKEEGEKIIEAYSKGFDEEISKAKVEGRYAAVPVMPEVMDLSKQIHMEITERYWELLAKNNGNHALAVEYLEKEIKQEVDKWAPSD